MLRQGNAVVGQVLEWQAGPGACEHLTPCVGALPLWGIHLTGQSSGLFLLTLLKIFKYIVG